MQHSKESIRDAFISGLTSGLIRQRLLENKTLDLSMMFDQAQSLATAAHSSESYTVPLILQSMLLYLLPIYHLTPLLAHLLLQLHLGFKDRNATFVVTAGILVPGAVLAMLPVQASNERTLPDGLPWRCSFTTYMGNLWRFTCLYMNPTLVAVSAAAPLSLAKYLCCGATVTR